MTNLTLNYILFCGLTGHLSKCIYHFGSALKFPASLIPIVMFLISIENDLSQALNIIYKDKNCWLFLHITNCIKFEHKNI